MLSPVDRNHTDVMQNHTYNNVQCCLMSSFFLVDELLQIWPKRPRGLEDELMRFMCSEVQFTVTLQNTL